MARLQQQLNQCVDEFNELICVTFVVTFTVTAECEVTGVDCLGPCPEVA